MLSDIQESIKTLKQAIIEYEEWSHPYEEIWIEEEFDFGEGPYKTQVPYRKPLDPNALGKRIRQIEDKLRPCIAALIEIVEQNEDIRDDLDPPCGFSGDEGSY
jgi:hypothetical protein